MPLTRNCATRASRITTGRSRRTSIAIYGHQANYRVGLGAKAAQAFSEPDYNDISPALTAERRLLVQACARTRLREERHEDPGTGLVDSDGGCGRHPLTDTRRRAGQPHFC